MPMRKPDEEKSGKQTIVRKKQKANGCPGGHETTVRERHETTVRIKREIVW